jgi:RNA polymerase sigma factor (sigma-70 family)
MDTKGMGDVGQVPPAGRNEDFIEQLCRAYEAQLIQYLTRMLGQTDLAREVAQDTYEKLHKMYRPEDVLFPRAILFKIATNLALMRLRRARLEKSIVTGPAGMDQVADESAPPDKRAMADEINERLVQTIKELRPNLRQPFIMAYIQGKPRKEIAEQLGISLKRVDKRLTRALSECRERLASIGIDPLRVD